MSWQDSFVPENQTAIPQAVQQQGWQSSFVPDDSEQKQAPQDIRQPVQTLPGEDTARQLGLTGRYMIEGPASILTGLGDLVNMGINAGTGALNKYTGKNIPQLGMPSQILGQKLDELGYPNPHGKAEEAVAFASKLAAGLMTGGEQLISTSKQAWGNLNDMISNPAAEESQFIVPKSSDIKLIKEKLDLAGITPEQYAEALKNSSTEDFAGELGGDPLRMQTQAQAKITGPAMQEARDAMRERLANAPQRTAQIISQNIKPAENVESMLSNIDDMQKQLPALYEEAYRETAPSNIVSDIVSRPAGQQALSATVEKLSNQGINPLESGIVKNNNGTWRFTPDVPVKTLDEFQRSLGDLVSRNPITGAVEGSDAATIESMRKSVTSSLAETSPTYQKALNVAAAKQQAESAFEMGRQLAKSAAGEKADAIMSRASEVMSPNELSYQRAGYAQGLTDATKGVPLGTGSPASRIANGKVINTVGSVLDSSTQAEKFSEALMQEKNRIDLAQRGLGGSNTAETLTSGIPEVPTSLHGAAASLFNKVQDFAQAGKNARIAQLLYATAPEQKALLARKLLGK